jgi:hypothetical protein
MWQLNSRPTLGAVGYGSEMVPQHDVTGFNPGAYWVTEFSLVWITKASSLAWLLNLTGLQRPPAWHGCATHQGSPNNRRETGVLALDFQMVHVPLFGMGLYCHWCKIKYIKRLQECGLTIM